MQRFSGIQQLARNYADYPSSTTNSCTSVYINSPERSGEFGPATGPIERLKLLRLVTLESSGDCCTVTCC